MDITWPVKRLRYRYMIAIPLAMAAVFAAAFVIQGVPLSMDFAGGTYLNISTRTLKICLVSQPWRKCFKTSSEPR